MNGFLVSGGKNGKGGEICKDVKEDSAYYYWAGCGYFEGAIGNVNYSNNTINRVTEMLGGASNLRENGHEGGSGGTAGSGGDITVESTCKVYAFNGNRYTDGRSNNNGFNQTPIYCQAGIIPEKYKYLTKTAGIKFYVELVSEKENVSTLSYVNSAYTNSNKFLEKDYNKYLTKKIDMSKQGIGSGAGYYEDSNGTYTLVD